MPVEKAATRDFMEPIDLPQIHYLEALVYAHEIVLHIGKHLRKNIFSKKISTPIYDLTKPETPKEILTILTQTLHNVMQHYRGIVLQVKSFVLLQNYWKNYTKKQKHLPINIEPQHHYMK